MTKSDVLGMLRNEVARMKTNTTYTEAIGLDGDDEIGQQSNIVSVVFGG